MPETLADPSATLPDDPAILQQMVLELLAALRNDAARRTSSCNTASTSSCGALYGPRTERFDPNQPLLIPDAFEPVAPETSEPGPTRSRPSPNRATAPRRSRVPTAAGSCPRISVVCLGSTS